MTPATMPPTAARMTTHCFLSESLSALRRRSSRVSDARAEMSARLDQDWLLVWRVRRYMVMTVVKLMRWGVGVLFLVVRLHFLSAFDG